jgi:signal transduction histidine kinase
LTSRALRRIIARPAGSRRHARRMSLEPPPARDGLGLSTKLLGLTVLFVLIAEVLIYVPSVANYRMTWLRDRLASAGTAALILEAAPDGMVPRELELELLRQVGVMTISVKRGEARRLLAVSDMPPMVDATYDLRGPAMWEQAGAALRALRPGERTIRVLGSHPTAPDGFVEIVLPEAPLRAAMLAFSWNILLLSLAISVISAGLLFLALNRLFVRPMRGVHASMMAFRQTPEDPGSIIVPSTRGDEIGRAERELRRLQLALQGALQQKTHLAALGLAVAKINHDLRNILASAQLFSDRLAAVKEPTVQGLMPKLLAALDRAIALCRDTLAYGRAREPEPERRRLPLAPVVDEVGSALGLDAGGRIAWTNRVAPDLEVDADPDQLFRVLLNLGRNAVEAVGGAEAEGAAQIAVAARREGAVTVIEVADTGPGVPDKLRAELFQPFVAGRRGGAGLGLAIAAELVRGHGGEITLAEGTLGATFLVSIPDRAVDLAERRARRASGA